MGVIDSISEGLALIRRRPAIMLVPIVLDLLIWVAPQFSLEPLTDNLAENIVLPQAMTGPQAYDSIEAARQLLQSFGQDSNLLTLLGNGLVGVPSFLSGGLPDGGTYLGGQVSLSNPLLVLGLTLLFFLLGLGLAAIYLTLIGQAVKGEAITAQSVSKRALRTGKRLLGLVLLLFAFLAAIGVPVVIMVSLLSLLSPGLASMILSLTMLLVLWGSLWAVLYLFFVVDAMVLQDVGAQRAILNSVIVVRTNFWPALALVVLLNLLTVGLSIMWHWLAGAVPAGMLLAIAGNAFVGSGLIAASFVFYRDRYDSLLKMISAQGG